jgi:hypothetical protein
MRKVMNMEDTISNEIVKYYLYTESMFKDERPIEEPLKFYETEDVHQAAQECVKEIPIWMLPALEADSIEEGWASISIYIDHKVILGTLRR